MHLQTLSSGSKGNATLVRADETHLLVDAGLSSRALFERLEAARVQPRRIQRVLLTHGHLDHARGAAVFSRRGGATVHCCQRLMENASLRRAPRLARIPVGREFVPEQPQGGAALTVRAVKIPHDADPTVAFRLEHGGRVAVILTDIGRPDRGVGRALAGAHLLVLEFNHDAQMLRAGPYAESLKRRIAGDGGHLSNDQAGQMLGMLAGRELHTLVLAHLSETNNTPELALETARRTLGELGLHGVRVVVAGQDGIGPNLEV